MKPIPKTIDDIPKTTNPSFNDAIKLLVEYHPDIVDAMGKPMLNFQNRPKIRSNREWQLYLNALLTVQVIGQRNKWTRRHVNRRGCDVFLLIDIPEEGKAK